MLSNSWTLLRGAQPSQAEAKRYLTVRYWQPSLPSTSASRLAKRDHYSSSSDKLKEQPCSCGWHTKAATRKQLRLQVAQRSSAMTSASAMVSVTATTSSAMAIVSTDTTLSSAMAGTSASDSGSSLVVPVPSSPPPQCLSCLQVQ